MPYAKTSLRQEKHQLREKMRALGLDYRDIAAEFARRYQLRPRAAWREAYGWSLRDTASRINEFRGDTGLDPGGFAGMTAPHLCEHENWPGHGARPSGRRPTPYLLALLAAVYGCAVTDLIDLADREHLPPADLLILDKYSPGQPGTSQAITSAPASPPARPSSVPGADDDGRPSSPDQMGTGGVPGHDHLTRSAICHLPLVPGDRFERFPDRTRGGDGRARRERARRASRAARHRGRHPGAAAQRRDQAVA